VIAHGVVIETQKKNERPAVADQNSPVSVSDR
jgi:hypothetical protein